MPAGSLWSPEGRALCAAMRGRLGLPAPAQPATLDWSAVLALAAVHRVEGLLEPQQLDALGAGDDVVESAAGRRRLLLLQALPRLALQRHALGALRRARLDVVVLKGAPLAAEAFGSSFARTDVDIDLLVAAPDVPAAAAALEGIGLRWAGWLLPDATQTALADGVGLPLLPEAIFRRDGQSVELHWRLTRNARLMPPEAQWLRAPREVEVDGRPIAVLPQVPAFLHLAVHGTLHRWQRLKWLVDLPALVARTPALVAPAVLAEAERRGLDRCLATGILLAERALGPCLPPAAHDWARTVRGTKILLRQSTVALGAGHSAPGGVRRSPTELLTHVSGRLAVRRDARFRVVEARDMLLEAANAHTAPRPSASVLAAAPLRWIARSHRATSLAERQSGRS